MKRRSITDLRVFSNWRRSGRQPKARRLKFHGARAVRGGEFLEGSSRGDSSNWSLDAFWCAPRKKGGLRRPMSGISDFSIVNARPVARFRCAHRLSALHALSDIRIYLADFYSHTGRPSVVPELLIRMLLVGALIPPTKRRLMREDKRPGSVTHHTATRPIQK